MSALKRCVVDQDVEPTELRDGTFYELVAMILFADVTAHEHRLAAGFADPVGRFLRIPILTQ